MSEVLRDEVSFVIKSSSDNARESVKGLTSDLSNLSNAIKAITAVGFLKELKNLGKNIYSFTEKAADYVQNVNQFKMVMGNYAKITEQKGFDSIFGKFDKQMVNTADNFLSKAENILGLDPTGLQNSLVTFKSLAESFGIANEDATKMSRNLTQLAADMSSMKNISFDQALQKIKSGFVGEIEPMRAVGVALDKATLQETAYRLGIEQRIDTMTRAQKTELLYYQIMNSTTQMQGNMAKNLLTPATAIRQIQTEFAQLGRAIGSIFIPMLMKVLPYIRAITELASEAAQAIASMFGFKLGDYTTQIADTGVALGDVGAGIEDIGTGAGKAAKELNKMLMPFDELNNINLENKSGGSGGTGGIGSVGGSLGIPIQEYDMFKNASDEMRKKIDSIKESIKAALPIIKNFAIAIGAIWVIKKVLDFIIYLGKVKEAFSTLKSVIKNFDKTGLIGKISDGLKNLFWNTNLGKSIKNFKDGTGGLSKVFLNLASAIGGTILSIKGFKDVDENLNNYLKTGNLDVVRYTGSLLELSGGFALVGFSINGLGGAIAGGLIGAVVGGIQSLGIMLSKTSEMHQGAIDLNNAIKEQKEVIDKDKESWDRLNESTNEAILAELSQTNYMKQLVDELDTYSDSSGKVNDSDKERVSFILNELNNAYGTNYKLVDNQITKNGEEKASLEELKDAIQEVIDKKKAEALINAMQDKYAEAIQKQKTYYNEYQSALESQGKTVEKIKELYKKYGIELKEVNQQTIEEANSKLHSNAVLDMTKDGLIELMDSYEKTGQAVEDSKYMWEDSVQTINQFEDLKTAVVTGNNDKMQKSIENITDVVEVNGIKQKESTEQSLKRQLEEYEKFGKDRDESQRKYAEKQIKTTADTLAKETQTVQTLTPEQVKAWQNLAEMSKDTYDKSITLVSEGTRLAIETATGQIDISKPESLKKWKELASSSEEEYKRALGLLPGTTSSIIQQAVGSIESNRQSLNNEANSVGSTAGFSLTQGFIDNLKLKIDAYMIQIQNTEHITQIGKGIAQMIQRGMGTIKANVSSSIEAHANGGFPTTGQLFIANEAGPELIGNIGRRTAVANQSQITEGIATATYNAISRALAENKGTGNTSPYIVVNLGNEKLYSGYGNYQSEQSNMYGVAL